MTITIKLMLQTGNIYIYIYIFLSTRHSKDTLNGQNIYLFFIYFNRTKVKGINT